MDRSAMERSILEPSTRTPDTARRPAPAFAPSLGEQVAAAGAGVTPLRALPTGPGQVGDTPVARQDRLYAAGRRHNLPQPLTSFVGRQREIAEVRRLLDSARLLTLTGSCGVGKTRLSHEVAARMLDVFHGGVWVVELAALTDQALVPQMVATVLDVREEADRPLTASLAAALRPERLLLVLDNCEHLIEACASIADALLRACPDLSILATSRQALGTAGETTFCVPTLSLSASRDQLMASSPSEGETRELHAGPARSAAPREPSIRSEAVQLFVERARAVVPAFALTDRNLAMVEKVCQRLDGIPLAIELAAARVAVLTPEQIAVRLDDRFRLLSGGSRTALPRYRTLRALVDWSHDLLG